MSEIVDRLRSPIIGIPNAVALCIEAADEIERLSAEGAKKDRALREARTKLVRYFDATGGEYCGGMESSSLLALIDEALFTADDG